MMATQTMMNIDHSAINPSQPPAPKRRKLADSKFSQIFHPSHLSQRDLQFEEDVKLHPYYLKNWLFYIQTKQDEIDEIESLIADNSNNKSLLIQYKNDRMHFISTKYLLYERALQRLPGSYKLWHKYLTDRIDFVCTNCCIIDPMFEETNDCFERCLTFLHKMPRIWMMYTEFLTFQRFIHKTRNVFDRMLKALPITQHDRVWPLYLKFVRIAQVPEMAVSVYRRFVQLYPDQMEEFVDYLLKQKRFDEAALRVVDIVNNECFHSIKGKSKYDFWQLLCQILVKNAKNIHSVNVDAIIRSGIKKYPQQIGKLWTYLAEYYVRLGQFEKARDIYWEGINCVLTVRDFGIIFDSFAQFEENMICIRMNDENDTENNEDLQLRIDRLEELYKDRSLLLSSVNLRQNPHSVDEWLKRAKIFIESEDEIDAEKVVEVYTQAIATIDPYKVHGCNHKLSAIWIEFAKFYEEYGDDLEDIRIIFEKATKAKFKNIDDLASIWCEWAEMELRHKNYEKCRTVLKMATNLPSNMNVNELLSMKHKEIENIAVQKRLFKSKKLWSFLCDIEESLGTLQEAKCVYNTVIDLKVASVQTILNFADLMERNAYFEESFKIYERGIALFGYPHVIVLWKTYLHKFVSRYGANKLERARDLFEECLSKCPKTENMQIYLMYARFEEKYGFARHAMRVYDNACLNVDEAQRKQMFHIYINRAADLFGITRTRQIYEKAIENLADEYLADLCLSFVSLELKLSEIDRARSIFCYGAQFANPKSANDFWSKWHEFEVQFGNEETFKEMLRIQRSVDSEFCQSDFNEQIVDAAKQKMAKNAESELSEIQEMELRALQRQKIEQTENVLSEEDDPNEIEIDIGDENENEIELEQQAIPSAVYAQNEKKKIGALDRFNA